MRVVKGCGVLVGGWWLVVLLLQTALMIHCPDDSLPGSLLHQAALACEGLDFLQLRDRTQALHSVSAQPACN